MKGNFHVQFLGEGVAATSPPYPTPRGAIPWGHPARNLSQDEWKPMATPTFHHPSPRDWRRSSSSAVHGSFTPKASVIPVENPPEIPQGIVASYRIQGWLRVIPYGKKEAQESLASKDRG